MHIKIRILQSKLVEDGLDLVTAIPWMRGTIYVCTDFFPLSVHLVMAPKTLKNLQFMLSEVVRLEKAEEKT